MPGDPGQENPLTVGPDGTIYFSADRNNAIYRVRPVR